MRVPAPCPVCGSTELPRMTPELLWFKVGNLARRGARMPDGRWAVLAGTLIVSLSDDEWRHYEAMRKHDAETVLASELMEGRAAA